MLVFVLFLLSIKISNFQEINVENKIDKVTEFNNLLADYQNDFIKSKDFNNLDFISHYEANEKFLVSSLKKKWEDLEDDLHQEKIKSNFLQEKMEIDLKEKLFNKKLHSENNFNNLNPKEVKNQVNALNYNLSEGKELAQKLEQIKSNTSVTPNVDIINKYDSLDSKQLDEEIDFQNDNEENLNGFRKNIKNNILKEIKIEQNAKEEEKKLKTQDLMRKLINDNNNEAEKLKNYYERAVNNDIKLIQIEDNFFKAKGNIINNKKNSNISLYKLKFLKNQNDKIK